VHGYRNPAPAGRRTLRPRPGAGTADRLERPDASGRGTADDDHNYRASNDDDHGAPNDDNDRSTHHDHDGADDHDDARAADDDDHSPAYDHDDHGGAGLLVDPVGLDHPGHRPGPRRAFDHLADRAEQAPRP
jgi:hypothetical protein